MSVGDAIEWARQPEYTGENRCLPCTAVNLVLAAAASLALGAVWPPLGVVGGVVSLAAIYLRGYLVPGTPTLTKRYLPERVLRWFDKAPEPPATEDATGGAGVEAILRDAGAIEECPDRDDLCLSPGFREEWSARIEAYSEQDTADAAAGLLDVADVPVSVTEGENAFAVNVGGHTAGRWPSRAAFVADAAAADVLAERDSGWAARDREGRNALLNSLRLFVETCPECGGPVELGEDRVESCCREIDVAAAECSDCGVRVFETALPDRAAQP
ncbi:MAG: hypothetical protein ABEH77_01985 [Halobacteriaceae archaeon]